MRVASLCSLLVLVAGCPPKRGGGGPAVVEGAGCPAAAGVYVASYLTPEEGSSGGHTGWVLPLHDRVVDTLDGVPAYATLDAAAASAAGVPAPPAKVWLLVPGAAPCEAKVGAYYAAAIDAPSKNIAYGVELAGCAAPPDASDASTIALASDAPPTGCQLVPPKPVATRLGAIDKTGRWSPPTTETAIPPALTRVLPARECPRASCEQLWSVAQVDLGGTPVAWAAAINWLELPPDAEAATREAQCAWKAETFSGFFIAGPDGAPVQVTEGQDHPLLLTGVLADAGGAKVLVAAGPGEYTAYDLVGGRATVGRHLVWLVPHPDSFTGLDRLGPLCP